MRDRLGYCAKCLVSFTEEPQGNENPDLCLWCEKDLTDERVWMADQHVGQPLKMEYAR